jgi:hypothetical protein
MRERELVLPLVVVDHTPLLSLDSTGWTRESRRELA